MKMTDNGCVSSRGQERLGCALKDTRRVTKSLLSFDGGIGDNAIELVT